MLFLENPRSGFSGRPLRGRVVVCLDGLVDQGIQARAFGERVVVVEAQAGGRAPPLALGDGAAQESSGTPEHLDELPSTRLVSHRKGRHVDVGERQIATHPCIRHGEHGHPRIAHVALDDVG